MEAAALVTGAARRIGKAIALALAGKGYDIALHYRSSRGEAEALAGRIEAAGRKCTLFQRDFNRMEEVLSLVPAVFDAHPGCNVLVNNAAVFERAELAGTDEDIFERHFNVNFKAPFFLSRDFASRCKAGHIINILDTRTARASRAYAAYALSKQALGEFTKLAAKALAPGVRVNGVCPGLILPAVGQDDAQFRKMARRIPMARPGRADDVADAVCFLLDNHFVTGQCIFVDGGQHLV